MKRIFVLCLCLLALSVTSFAQTGKGQKEFKELDLNKDGKLDREEFNKKASQMVKKIDLRMDKTFERMDANKDGFLDKAEMRQARAKRDKNSRAGAHGKAKNHQKKSGKKDVQAKREQVKKRFQALDKNGNKVLSFREFKKGAKMRPNYTRARAKGMFNKMDTNNDGLLGPKEFTQSKVNQKVKQKRRKRMRGRR